MVQLGVSHDKKVYLVDGKKIRATKDKDFTNWASGDNKPYVPKGEIWIDKQSSKDEHGYYQDNANALSRFVAKGHPYEKAREMADAVENRERHKLEPGMDGSRAGVYKRLIKSAPGKPKIWEVHGDEVRKRFKTDYTEGGHGLVYNFIPKNEVWMDDNVDPSESKNFLVHELHERNLMAGGLDYRSAHKKANQAEAVVRKNPDAADRMIDFEYHKSEAYPKSGGKK